jgi:hypothetical protein
VTGSRPPMMREDDVKAIGCIFRNKRISGALAVALYAASAASTAEPAYALKLDAVHVARERTRADQDRKNDDPSLIAALSSKCPDILADPWEYDDALIALCLKAWRRP